jgi:hypothetical protein
VLVTGVRSTACRNAGCFPNPNSISTLHWTLRLLTGDVTRSTHARAGA